VYCQSSSLGAAVEQLVGEVEVPVEMSLGRRADYAIRATLDLARSPGALRKSREIGEAMAVPVSFLPQILAQLVKAGIASSTAGPRGGYGLARDPASLSLLDVVVAVDGEVAETPCVLRGGPCHWEDRCAVHVPWARAKQAMMDELASTSFADLVRLDRTLEAIELVAAVEPGRAVTEPVAVVEPVAFVEPGAVTEPFAVSEPVVAVRATPVVGAVGPREPEPTMVVEPQEPDSPDRWVDPTPGAMA
jgi:Rrf2 family protein